MNPLTPEQVKQIVVQWKAAGPALERIRRDELKRWRYNWKDVDELLSLGDLVQESRPTSGLVEMQRRFAKLARRQGL